MRANMPNTSWQGSWVAANEQLKLEKWVLDSVAPAMKHSGAEGTHVDYAPRSLAKSSHRSPYHANTNKAKN